MEDSMTQQLDSDLMHLELIPSAGSLVNSQLPSDSDISDGEKLNSDALCGVSLDHLSGVELIWDSKQNT